METAHEVRIIVAEGSSGTQITLEWRDPTGTLRQTVGPCPAPIDRLDLAEQVNDLAAYGATLTAQCFADPALVAAVAAAYQAAGEAGLRVRLVLPEALHALRWELLGNPLQPTQPLASAWQTPLSRLVGAEDEADDPTLVRVTLRPKAAVRALIAIAEPTDLSAYRLASLRPAEEALRLQHALGAVPSTRRNSSHYCAACTPRSARA